MNTDLFQDDISLKSIFSICILFLNIYLTEMTQNIIEHAGFILTKDTAVTSHKDLRLFELPR